MINKVILVGNVGRDPEVNYIQPDVAVARFSVATDESYKKKDGTWENRSEWHRITAWRGQAQYCERSIRKGQMVYVEGKLQTRKYQDQNGVEKYTTDIIANTIRILNKRDGSDQNPMSNDGYNQAPQSAPSNPQPPAANQFGNQPSQPTQQPQQYSSPTQNPPFSNDDPFSSGDSGEDDGLPF